jgi:Sec-independent protein translocase protein TatA
MRVFEGALSPWHLAILAFALFLFIGPKKIAHRLDHLGKAVQHAVEDDDVVAGDQGARTQEIVVAPPTQSRRAYRLGRRLSSRWRTRRSAS